jgi:UDP-3-O-[3-hydroxymyristoyl] N-acetylglucosamine deacetylase
MLSPFSVSGIGVHTGEVSTVSIVPAEPGSGIVFIGKKEQIPASVDYLSADVGRRTAFQKNRETVETVEHLFAALAAFDLRDLRIDVSGPEIPILDGSAAPWFEMLLQKGARRGFGLLPVNNVNSEENERGIKVVSGNASAEILPVRKKSDAFIEVVVELSEISLPPMIRRFYPASDCFEDIAPARTFVFEHELKPLLDANLAKGGSPDNALVLSNRGPLNPGGLRFPDEPARHKLLDVIGDLFVLGGLPCAQIRLFRPGHHLNHEIARRLRRPVRRRL